MCVAERHEQLLHDLDDPAARQRALALEHEAQRLSLDELGGHVKCTPGGLTIIEQGGDLGARDELQSASLMDEALDLDDALGVDRVTLASLGEQLDRHDRFRASGVRGTVHLGVRTSPDELTYSVTSLEEGSLLEGVRAGLPHHRSLDFNMRILQAMIARVAQRPSIHSLLACAMALAACTTEPEITLDPDPSASAELGARGPYGAARIERSLRARVDDTITVEITLPVDTDGELLDGPLPVTLFVHGGLVSASRYGWIAEHIASRGHVVISPSHTFDLALFQSGNALDALEGARALAAAGDPDLTGRLSDEPVVAIGHSLGGVVAAGAWIQRPDLVRHLVMLASEPAPGEPLAERGYDPSSRVVSIVGTQDGLQRPEDALAGVEELSKAGAPVSFGLVEGMNHFQFVEDPTADELGRDQESTRELDSARALSLYLLDATLDASLGLPSGGALDDPTRWPDGLLTYDAFLASQEDQP